MSRTDVIVAVSIEGQIQWILSEFVYKYHSNL